MRNLKKVLSLSLALVMLLGMMVVGASAATKLEDFKDVKDITEKYTEAVDLLSAISILEGNEKTEYMPKGNLTREAAAKIVTYLALGVDAAEALSATAAPFKDVAANRWSAGYISYCASVGIINGDGNGSFFPAANVTGYEFGKMLLCVLGYGEKEEYVGSNWALNVAKDGTKVGLFKGLPVSNAVLTREEAAQMAFNTLKLPLVSFSSLFGTYSSYTSEYGRQELLGTLAKNIFAIESKDGDTDGYGRSVHFWTKINSNKALTENYLSGTVVGTETSSSLTNNELYKAYTWDENIALYINGTLTGTQKSASLKGSSVKPFESYKGYIAYIMDEDNDGEADKVIVVIEYLAEVTAVTAATKTADRTITLSVYDNSSKLTGVIVETEDFAKGDMILVAPSSNGPSGFKTPLEMKKAETFTNTVSAFYKSATGSVTTGGNKYSYNGIFNYVAGMGQDLVDNGYTLNTKASYQFYLDSRNNVIGVKTLTDAISDFAYISKVGYDAFGSQSVVKVVLSDGTTGTYTLSSKSDSPVIGHIYGYSINANKEIVLTTLNGSKYYDRANTNYNTISNFTKSYSTIQYGAIGTGTGSYAFATDTTVFIYINGSTINRYVGKANAPTFTDTTKAAAIAVENKSGTDYATMVVINAAPASTVGSNYFLALNDEYVGYSTDKNGDRIYYFEVIKDGEKKIIALYDSALIELGLYQYGVNDLFAGDTLNNVEPGVYTVENYTNVNNQVGTVYLPVNNNVLVLDAQYGQNYVVTSETKIVSIDANGKKVSNITASDLAANDVVQVLYNTTGGVRIATTIYRYVGYTVVY